MGRRIKVSLQSVKLNWVRLVGLRGLLAFNDCALSVGAARLRIVFDSDRLFGFAESGTCVVTTERNQCSIGSDILDDAALEAA